MILSQKRLLIFQKPRLLHRSRAEASRRLPRSSSQALAGFASALALLLRAKKHTIGRQQPRMDKPP